MKKKRKTLVKLKKGFSKLKKRSSAFTLTEMLVSVVIIGVLSMTIFLSSATIIHNATVASIVNHLDNVSKQIRMFNLNKNMYPNTVSCSEANSTTNECISMDNGIAFEYKVDNTTPRVFCIEASKGDITYNVNQSNSTPQPGPCPEVKLEVDSPTDLASGDTWKDKSGNSNDGNLVNGATYTDSNGGAVGLDGVDDYVDVKHKVNDNQGCISMWYYARSWYQYQQIFDNSQDPNSWEMWIDTDGALHSRITGNLSVSYDLDNIYGPNHWYHIATCWKKSSTELKLFINGSQRNSNNSGNWVTPGDDIYFGGGNSQNSKANGLIRSISISDKKMSESDIKYTFDHSKSQYGL